MAHILPILRHCTSMRSAVGLGGLAPAVLRCECNGQLDGSRLCKFEKASRLATTALSRTECIRQPTRVCIKLTTCKGHEECLLAAQEACQPCYRKLHLSMAASWLSLARQDEAIDNLLATSWNLVPDPQTCVSGNG